MLFIIKKLEEKEIKDFILQIKQKNYWLNITVPFKKVIISHLDQLSLEAKQTQSVNTIFLKIII